MRCALAFLALALVPATAVAVPPVTLLTTAKTAVLRGGPGTIRVLVRVGADPALAPLASPLCPGGAWLQLGWYPQATNLVESLPASAPGAALPCAAWRRVPGGYRYHDPAGAMLGVREVLYGDGGLLIRLSRKRTPTPSGPVGYFEAWLTVGERRYLVRFHNFRRNDETAIVSRRPSRAAARGEAFFWQTMWGDAERTQEALDCLGRAVRHDRRDGRSRFLIAMLHLYRFGQAITDYRHVSPAALQDLHAAQDAFDDAVPLLWDAAQRRGDSRVPGFAAANRYLLGVIAGDPALVQQGLADLEVAVAINPIFNAFDLLGVVPQVVAPDDPLFTERVLPVLDAALSPGGAACLNTQPEICNDFGMAPRNVAGSLVLFGDIYAKGGRPSPGPGQPSDVEQAETWYSVAQAFSAGWPFASVLDDRLGLADVRRLAYRDADPDNDPPIVGTGPQTCALCHNR